MFKVAFLNSGGGGNLRFLHASISKNVIHGVEVSHIFCLPGSKAKEFAVHEGIPFTEVSFKKENQFELLRQLKKTEADLYVANINYILIDEIVDFLKGRILNLHYSILPAFDGLMDQVAAHKEKGCKLIGCTVHVLTKKVDGGPQVVQAAFPLSLNLKENMVRQIHFLSGGMALLAGVYSVLFAQSYPCTVEFIKGAPILINPGLPIGLGALLEKKIFPLFEENL